MIIRRIAKKEVKKKVAAYARVSTLSEAQEESYETQVNYYTQLIQQTASWEMVGVYADPGITGTSARKRPEFMRMIGDAKNDRIDLILCKSVSRFSRNFREAQELIHELKAHNVEVWFEKEGIHTFNPSADLIFSLMAAISQEESRSISENVKWSYRKLAEQGIRHVGNHRMLGYDEVNGKLAPNKDAWIVRMAFEEYADGVSASEILKHLQDRGAHRLRSDKPFAWSAILTILRNEAYVGDRLIQKTSPQDFLTKKPDPLQSYDSKYIRNDHEPIVSREVWEKAQNRLKTEKEARDHGMTIRNTSHFLFGKVFCSECGEPYRRYTARRSSGEYYKTWRCRGRVNGKGCRNRHIEETEILGAIAAALEIETEKIHSESIHDLEKVLIQRKTVVIRKAAREIGA